MFLIFAKRQRLFRVRTRRIAVSNCDGVKEDSRFGKGGGERECGRFDGWRSGWESWARLDRAGNLEKAPLKERGNGKQREDCEA